MSAVLALAAGALAATVVAQVADPAAVTLKTTPVAGSVSMISGADGFAGGNVAVSVGDDGVFMIDDHLQPLSAKLKAAVAGLSRKPIRFVMNTHWHGDHTGGNAALGAGGAVLMAHDNVRKRLSVGGFMQFMGKRRDIPASPREALPVVTFAQDVTLHLNGDEIHAMHVGPAHTDGDVIVHFTKAKVIHTGDTFVDGYPRVDVVNGGNYLGFIGAAERVLGLCDAGTRIIRGHGDLASCADVRAWRDMLVGLRDRVAKLVAAKKTVDEVKAAKPTAEWDARYGQGAVKADDLVPWVYDAVSAAATPAAAPRAPPGASDHRGSSPGAPPRPAGTAPR